MTDPSRYGDLIADVYDTTHEGLAFLDPAPVVERLSELAGSGPILEVGVGTGRIAIPLAKRGHEVHGVDVSARMIDRLRAKDTSALVRTYTGDFLSIHFETQFALVFLVYNTFLAFASQENQLQVFAKARAHLVEGGLLVLETYVPNVSRDQPSRTSARVQGADGLILETSRHNLLTQHIETTIAFFSSDGLKVIPLQTRYIWPAELDLMARLNRFDLVERCGGWAGQPFTAQSSDYVSVFRAAPG
jgi:SAM-dependent methyltransferase